MNNYSKNVLWYTSEYSQNDHVMRKKMTAAMCLYLEMQTFKDENFS